MVTQKLFRSQPYLKTSKAHIVKIDGNTIELDSTIFFAFSGGQESDNGTIERKKVIQAIDKEDGTLAYELENVDGLKKGQEVIIEIDWEKRYRLMRLHSLAHLAHFAFEETVGKKECIGSNVSFNKSRLDYVYEENLNTVLPKVQARVEQWISEGHEIQRFAQEGTEDRWIWKMDKHEMPCGGTHVKNTNEIESIKLKRANIGKGKERIECTLVE